MSKPAQQSRHGWTTSSAKDLQTPFDAAVVVATILRPTLMQAVRSIFAQELGGRIQILIGIDKIVGDRGVIDRLQAECPSHCTITLCEPGYSTAALNGGVYSALTGGGLLAGLSTLANSRYVCYLDDDNWYAPEHLSSLRATINSESGWVHSLRWFVNSYDDRCIDIDRWHAVGPNAGLYAHTMGGLVDTNCYMIDKDRCWDMLWRWSHALQKKGAGNDRGVFASLVRKEPWRCSEQATVYYRLPPEREWVVHHWKWRGLEPKANLTPTPFGVVASAIRKALPRPDVTLDTSVEPVAPHEAYRSTIKYFKPRSLIDLWSGNGHRIISFVRAAREAGHQIHALAVDNWLPVPFDAGGKLRPLANGATLYDEFCRNVASAGVADMVTALPQGPGDAAYMLRPSNMRCDLLLGPADRGDAESMLRQWWPLLRPNALTLLECGALDAEEVVHRLADFAEARGARIGPMASKGHSLVAIRKSDPGAKRRPAPSRNKATPMPAG